jgi:voltage-gated potassium channel
MFGASMNAAPADLAAVPLFSTLSETDLAEIAGWFDAKNVGAGVRLIGEGASGYSFFVLADGSAAVTANGDEVGSLGPGDFFGEIAILGDGRRSATVTTTMPSRVLVMFGTEFRRLQQAQPAIASQIEATMGERVAH